MQSCNSMSNVAAHGAGMRGRRAHDYGLKPIMPLPQGPMAMEMDGGQCHFPVPHPHRIYCQPSAFHRVNGQEYHNMTTAYGASRPLNRYY
jgi:hypothetical protein